MDLNWGNGTPQQIPEVKLGIHMTDLFANFTRNFTTISPLVLLLCGVLFGFFILYGIKKAFMGDDD